MMLPSQSYDPITALPVSLEIVAVVAGPLLVEGPVAEYDVAPSPKGCIHAMLRLVLGGSPWGLQRVAERGLLQVREPDVRARVRSSEG
jgi:hypothetical protein